jgi:hypothetical protein
MVEEKKNSVRIWVCSRLCNKTNSAESEKNEFKLSMLSFNGVSSRLQKLEKVKIKRNYHNLVAN